MSKVNVTKDGKCVSVCKQQIAINNKNGWADAKPTIRISNTPAGKVTGRANSVGICDKDGNIVARLLATTDGEPVIKCGAKVALITDYDIIELD